ncbi:MAG: OsmC family peroxiredoxin [Solimonas sp.]
MRSRRIRTDTASRFEGVAGTNPEELIGAAHTGCFTMALSLALGEAGFTAEKLETTATVALEKGEGGFSIPAIKLVLKAKVPGIDDATFQEVAAGAKAGCPVSKVLRADSRSRRRSFSAPRSGLRAVRNWWCAIGGALTRSVAWRHQQADADRAAVGK